MFKFNLLSLLVLFLAGGVTPCISAQGETNCENLLLAGPYAEPKRAKFDRIVETTSSYGPNYQWIAEQYSKGLEYQKLGKLEQAESYYKKAAERGDYRAQYNLGVLYHTQGNLKKAKEYYEMASRKGRRGALTNLGVIMYNTNKPERAESYWKLAARNDDPVAQYNLGILYYKQRNLAEAEHYYQKAADNNDLEAQYNLSVLYHKMCRLEEARDYYIMTDLNSIKWKKISDIGAVLNLGALYFNKNETEEANRLFKLIAPTHETAFYLNKIGTMYEKSGDIEKAEYYYTVAAEHKDADALKNLERLQATPYLPVVTNYLISAGAASLAPILYYLWRRQAPLAAAPGGPLTFPVLLPPLPTSAQAA